MASLLFNEDVRKQIKDEISGSGSGEVMFVAKVSADREICSARPVARGNSVSVPALLPHRFCDYQQ